MSKHYSLNTGVEDPSLRAALQHAITQQAYKLRFSEPLEQEFRQYYNSQSTYFTRICYLLSILLFALIGVLDFWRTDEAAFEYILFVRYGIACPFFALLLAATFSQWYARVHELSLMVAITVGATLVMVVTILGKYEEWYLHVISLGILIMMLSSLRVLRFSGVCIGQGIVLLVANLMLSLLPELSLRTHLTINVLLLSFVVIALVTAYSGELYARRFYLQLRLLGVEQDALKLAQEHLQTLSSSDVETGLANRYAFSRRFVDEWSRAQRSGYGMGLLVFEYSGATTEDIRELGDILLRFTRRPGDFAARIANEQLVLCLVDIQSEATQQLALAVCHFLADTHSQSVSLLRISSLTHYPQPGDDSRQVLDQALAQLTSVESLLTAKPT